MFYIFIKYLFIFIAEENTEYMKTINQQSKNRILYYTIDHGFYYIGLVAKLN